MTFSVDTDSLRGLPRLLDRAGDDAQSSAKYLREHDDVAWHADLAGLSVGTLLMLLKPYHDRVVDLVDGQLTFRLRDTVRGDADRVADTITYYERTDAAAAARADLTWPGAIRPDLLPVKPDPVVQTPAFADTLEPTARLTPPPDHRGDLPHPMPVLKAGSFAEALRELVWQVTELGARLGLCDRPVDILEELVRPVVGDWPALHACADVFRNIGAACADMGENLATNQLAIHWTWSGNAADACREHLAGVELSLQATDARLRQIAAAYDRVASDVGALSQKLGDALGHLADLAAIALVEAEAAAITAPTGVGPLIFGSAAAADFYKFYKAMMLGFEIGKAIDILVHDFAHELRGFASLDDPSTMPSVPVPPMLPA